VQKPTQLRKLQRRKAGFLCRLALGTDRGLEAANIFNNNVTAWRASLPPEC
jgi:hypothetical protein